VAIVAIVGLVILFSGASTGATVSPADLGCPAGYQISGFVAGHGQLSYVQCERVPPPGFPSALWN